MRGGDVVSPAPSSIAGMPLTATHLLILAAFAASGFLAGLGGYPLLDNNEGLYARIALEMRASGDWVIPHLLGLPYLEKPPLLYWLTAASFTLIGETEFAARLAPALSGISVVGCAYWLGARSGRALEGWIAGLIISTSIVTLAIGRTLYFDMLYTAILSLALSFAYVGLDRRRAGMIRAAAALLGLAVLAKGLVAVGLCAIVLAAFLMMARAPASDWFRLLDPLAIAIFLAVIAPWHVMAAVRDDQFAWLYFVNEHLGRLLGTRIPKDYYSGAPWYYLPRLAAYAAPWTLLLPLALYRRAAAQPTTDRLGKFLWSWLLGTLAVFSFAGNKANYYMIVAIVPLALIIARPVSRSILDRRILWTAVMASLLYVAFVGGIFAADMHCRSDAGQARLVCRASDPASLLPYVVALALGAFALGIATDRRWRLFAPLLAIAFLAVPLRATAVRVQAVLEEQISERIFVERVEAVDDGRPIFVLGKLSDVSAFAFYFKRPFSMLENIDPEFYFARMRPEAEGRILKMGEFRRISDARPVYVVAENWRVIPLPEIPETPDLCVVLRTRKTSLLSNVPADCPPG
ncbi:MAG: glycosyltransferase family 39 protein [Rhodospirillales bacterium]|nr:glycosyltransferase family 39 protein [Rhodospirillales bacterium]